MAAATTPTAAAAAASPEHDDGDDFECLLSMFGVAASCAASPKPVALCSHTPPAHQHDHHLHVLAEAGASASASASVASSSSATSDDVVAVEPVAAAAAAKHSEADNIFEPDSQAVPLEGDLTPSRSAAGIGSVIKHDVEVLHTLKEVIDGFNGSLFDTIAFFHSERHKHREDLRSGNVVTDKDLVARISHYFKYALGALGWLYIGQDKDRISKVIHLDSGAVPIDNKQAVLQATGMAPEDYIDGWFPLLPDRTDFVPGWFVGVDRERKAVVAGFRSSISGKDWITDLIATYVPFKTTRAPNGMSHKGILDASRQSYTNLQPLILQTLERNPGYSFVTTGHSLGAGAASLVALMFHHDHGAKYKTECYAFACPSTVSPDISVAYRDVITTIALDVDVVPRLSLGSVEELRAQANQDAAERAKHNIISRIGQKLHHIGHKHAKPDADRTGTFIYLDENHKEHVYHQPRLVVPGTLVRFVHPPSWRSGQPDLNWQLEYETFDFTADIIITHNMFKRHLPIQYQHAIDYVLEHTK